MRVKVTRILRGKLVTGDMHFQSNRHAKAVIVQLSKEGRFRRAEYQDGTVVTLEDVKAWLKKG